MTTIKQPTPEEINEAAENYAHGRVFPPQKAEYSYSLLSIMKRQKEAAKDDFLAAISWLQNYQTKERGVVRSAEEIADKILSDSGKFVITKHDIIDAINESRFEIASITQLISAAKYGYEYHANTQFPELSFDDNCKNNFLQFQYAQSSQPQPNAISVCQCNKAIEVLNIAKDYQKSILAVASEFTTHPYAQYSISVIDFIIEEIQTQLNVQSILTKLKEQP